MKFINIHPWPNVGYFQKETQEKIQWFYHFDPFALKVQKCSIIGTLFSRPWVFLGLNHTFVSQTWPKSINQKLTPDTILWSFWSNPNKRFKWSNVLSRTNEHVSTGTRGCSSRRPSHRRWCFVFQLARSCRSTRSRSSPCISVKTCRNVQQDALVWQEPHGRVAVGWAGLADQSEVDFAGRGCWLTRGREFADWG